MGLFYNSAIKKLFIDWDERTRYGYKHWHGEFRAIGVFYHPKKPEIFRVRLLGKMPKWVERFASHNHYKYGATSYQGEEGFWLAKYNSRGDSPLVSPNIEGAINIIMKKIPEELHLRERLINYKDVVIDNLTRYPTYYNNMGLYYKKEEINGKEGTLLIEEDIFLPDDINRDDYVDKLRNDGRLEKLIMKLTTTIDVDEDLVVADVMETKSNEDFIFEENELTVDEEFISDEDVLVIEIEDRKRTTNESRSNLKKSATSKLKPRRTRNAIVASGKTIPLF